MPHGALGLEWGRERLGTLACSGRPGKQSVRGAPWLSRRLSAPCRQPRSSWMQWALGEFQSDQPGGAVRLLCPTRARGAPARSSVQAARKDFPCISAHARPERQSERDAKHTGAGVPEAAIGAHIRMFGSRPARNCDRNAIRRILARRHLELQSEKIPRAFVRRRKGSRRIAVGR